MTFADKVAALNATIQTQATALGLKFINGPGPEAFTPPKPNLGRANGQDRAVWLFGAAEG